MLLIFYTVFLGLIIRESPAFHLPDEPRLYPERSDVTVDAHSDLTLGCRGVEPMNWTFRDDDNDQYYNSASIHINSTVNEKEVSLKYESILTVYNVSRVNIGFYYCHAAKAEYNTARKSRRIYVFVHDENYLSVITSDDRQDVDMYWAGVVPCRPTSPDISITIDCYVLLNDESFILTVNPDNYTGTHRSSAISFHPYIGFQLHTVFIIAYYINDCKCVFARSNKVITEHFNRDSDPLGLSNDFLMIIGGPNTAKVGDDITLQCAVLTPPNFPYYTHGFEWKIPNKGNTGIAVHQPLKLKNTVLLNATITIKNISTENAGAYICSFYNKKLSKYVFINDEKANNYSAPSIYPSNSGEIQVNSRENITLRCSGSRPVTWLPKDEERTLYIYNQLNITSGKYEAYLHISALRYTDTGFYYCHENDSWSDHPFKSDKIYIFVKDEDNLYLRFEDWQLTVYPYTNVTVPCLPTSQDINVSLSLIYTARDPETYRVGPEQIIDSETYSYDRRKGFTGMVPGPGEIVATCTFITGNLQDNHSIIVYVDDGDTQIMLRVGGDPVMTGPSEDLVFVGQTLELSCAVFVYPNVPDDALRWTSPNNVSVNEIIPKVKEINFRKGKLLVSTLILDNVKISDNGRYSCHLDNASANKFISVYDEFDFEPNITILNYNVAYVGQPFAVLCNVSVDHNVELPVLSWTTPNETQVRAKIMGTKNITSVRNMHVHKLLQIDNVTYNDGGNYTCSLSAFTNRRKHVTTNIVVKKGVKPRIVRSNFVKEEEMDVLVQGTVNLTCFAEGDPEPVITWMKDSSEIRSGGRINITSTNTQLTVRFVQEIDAGRYTCTAQNPFGEDSHAVNLSVISVVISGWYIASLIGAIILTAAIAGLLTQNIYKTKKRRNALVKGNIIHFKDGQIQYFNPFLNMTEQATLLPYDTKWEIPRNKVELGRNLGSGSFGLVVEATVSNFFEGEPERIVAVKMLHPYSNFRDLNILISELKIMTHLGEHDNLINLLGACTKNIGEKRLLVVIEYCGLGNLRNYLMENRCNFVNLIDPDTEIICFPDGDSLQVDEVTHCSSSEPPPPPPPRMCTLQLLRWALQVARGMEFLAAKQILHGDLAARNILLTDNFIVKISDFGLSKMLSSGYYKKKSQCPLPIKWMAIESIRDKTFSSLSDVWAFGVVLWELFSLARIPYGELEPDLDFYRKLETGYRLERPEYSTRELYQVMRECWCVEPRCRPTFASLVRTFSDLLRDPRTVHVDAVDDIATSECSSSAASVLEAEPVDCVALNIDVLTTTDTL